VLGVSCSIPIERAVTQITCKLRNPSNAHIARGTPVRLRFIMFGALSSGVKVWSKPWSTVSRWLCLAWERSCGRRACAEV